ncbi:unnamed protein product, partial [Auanema sp. JU1783]
MNFHCFFLLLALVATAYACAPVQQDSSPDPLRRRRSIQEFSEDEKEEQVIITIVSQKPFDPLTVESNLEVLHKAVSDYETKEGIQYDVNTLTRITKNEGGKFAVEYKVEDDCQRVKEFILGAKKSSDEFNYATIR